MARNPGYLAPTQIRGPYASVPVGGNPQAAAAEGLAAFGRAAERLGDRLSLIEQRAAERTRQLEFVKAVTAAQSELVQVSEEIEPDPAWRTVRERFKERAQEILGRHAAAFDGDEERAVLFEARTREVALSAYRRVAAAARQAERVEAADTLDELAAVSLKRALQTEDPEERAAIRAELAGAIGTTRDAGNLTPGEAGRRLRAFDAAAVRGLADQAEDNARLLTAKDPGAALALLKDGAFPDLQGKSRAIAIEHAEALVRARDADAERRAARAEREQERAQGALRERVYSDLTIKASRGELTLEEVETEYARGILKPSDRATLTVAVERGEREAAKGQAAIARVGVAAATGAPLLDHRNAEDRKAVDQHYAAVAAGWQGAPVEEMPARIAAYVQAVGIVPKQVQGTIRAGLRSSDPGMVAQAADLLDRLQVARPVVIEDFAREDIDRGLSVASLVRAGTSAADAVRLTDERMRVSEPVKKAREAEIREGGLVDAGTKWLRGALAQRDNRWTARQPELPAELRGEFETLFRARYAATGAEAPARQAALADLLRVWSFSEVDGDGRWMRYAPEALYGNGRDPAWMGKQLRADVEGALAGVASDPKNADALKGRLRLMADDRTARGERPSWLVMMQDEFGAWAPLLRPDGRPLRWRPDWKASEAGRAEAARVDREVEAARGDRAMRDRWSTRERRLLDALRSGEPIQPGGP